MPVEFGDAGAEKSLPYQVLCQSSASSLRKNLEIDALLASGISRFW
jgi:hypothetical protein